LFKEGQGLDISHVTCVLESNVHWILHVYYYDTFIEVRVQAVRL